VFSAAGLYDPCLALSVPGRVAGNEVAAEGKSLIMITGANQGGKSTFLRSVGLGHLMMQAGMFVAADRLRANVCQGLFTHYRREEDATMTSGKLDEELSRMSQVADWVSPGCLLLCNESFAATNEREGSEIGRQVVRAMLHRGVKVCFVSHQFDLAHGFFRDYRDLALFLRAQRQEDGHRTFRLAEGEPLPTSFGQDVYQQVFAGDPPPGQAPPGG
jgi:DNA mismatch repair ATPase MutS